MKWIILYLALAVALCAQSTKVGGTGTTKVAGAGKTAVGTGAAPPPTNNVTVIQFTGANSNTGSTCTVASISTVTTGNSLLINAVAFGANTFSAAGVTMGGGTATIGTVVMTQHHDALSSSDNATANFRIPITGGGTITMLVTTSASTFIIVGVVEAHNLNASPDDVAGENTGTGSAQSSGVITSASTGIIMYCVSELSSSNFTRTFSDTKIFEENNGSTDYTGFMQYKLTTTLSNTLTSGTAPDSSAWRVGYAAYKTN